MIKKIFLIFISFFLQFFGYLRILQFYFQKIYYFLLIFIDFKLVIILIFF